MQRENIGRACVVGKAVVTGGPSHDDITRDRRTTNRNAIAGHELRNLGPSSAAVGKDVYGTSTTDCDGGAVNR